jgi:PAS domain S-box-containing protein
MLAQQVEPAGVRLRLPNRKLLYPVGGVIVAASIVVFLSLSSTNQALAFQWLIPLACLLLALTADLLGDPAGRNQQASFHHLALMSALLLGGPLVALVVGMLGTLLSAAVQVGLGRLSSIAVPTSREITRHVLLRLGAALPAVGVAAAVYQLAGGRYPFSPGGQGQLVAGVLAIIAGFITVRGLNAWLARWSAEVSLQAISSTQRARAQLTELSLVALPLAGAAAGSSEQPGLFLVLMGLLTANVIRRWRYSHMEARQYLLEEQNETLLHKLSLVNLSIQNAMFNVDQSEAIKTACETAIAVTKANKAAVFLIDREKEMLRLVESIGLTAEHRQMERDLPYQPELYSINPRIYGDTEQNVIPLTLRQFSQKARFRAMAEIPLRSGNVMVGYLSVFHTQPHVFTQTEINLLDILVNQLTAALDNAHLLRTLEIHAFEMTHLVHLSRIASSSLDMDVVARDIGLVLQQMTGMDYVGIGLLAPAAGQLRLLGSDRQPPPLEEVRLLQGRVQPLSVQVADSSEALRGFMSQEQLTSIHLIPMVTHEALMGVLLLGSAKARLLVERESQLLDAAANQIATQLSNLEEYLRTQEALQEQLEQAYLIEDLARKISSARDYNPAILLDDLYDAVFKTIPADSVALALRTDANDLWMVEQFRHQDGFERSYYRMPLNTGVVGRVIASGIPQLIADNQADPDYQPYEDNTYCSSLVVPLAIDEVVIGVLNVESHALDAFTETQSHFLQNLAGHASISLENGQLLEELQYQVTTLQNLRELALNLSSAEEPGSANEAVLKSGLHLAEAQYAILYRFNQTTQGLDLLAEHGLPDQPISLPERNAFNYIAQQAALTVEAKPYASIQPLLQADDTGGQIASIISIPIVRSYQVTEVLALGFTQPAFFEPRLMNALNLLAIQAAGHLGSVILYTRVQEGNNRMRAILSSARDGVIMLDPIGKLVDYNPAARRLLGVDLSDHMGESFVETLLRYAKEREGEPLAGYSTEELTRLARIFRLEPQGITRRQFTTQVNAKSSIFVEEIGSPVFDEESRMIGRMLTLRDITEEKSLEKLREEITRMAVHDLRAPLASIISALKMALENLAEPDQTPAVEQTIHMSLVSADKLMNIVESLLTIQRGKEMPLDRSSVSIEELVELARWTLLSSFEKDQIKLVVEIPRHTPLLYVDAEKIRRVIINLLDNACRYTPANSEVRLWVVDDRPRKKLVVHLADSGPGIPAKDRERIFEQFWQVKENQPLRGSKGSGIGLAFVARVLEAHGEGIRVEETGPLPGAHFSFTLPTHSGPTPGDTGQLSSD